MKNLIRIFVISLLYYTTASAQTEFWGTARFGGEDGLGCVFKSNYDGTGQEIVYSFQSPHPGKEPAGDLVQAANGKFYGYTIDGGSCGYGNLFEYDPATGTFTNLFDFDLDVYGANPAGTPMFASNGKIYGITGAGGPASAGTIFEFDTTSMSMVILHDFSGTNFTSNYNGNLIEAPNGKFYGFGFGGNWGAGVIFEYDLALDSLISLWDFDGTAVDGAEPSGTPLLATNGKLYGVTGYGGTFDYGVLFEYDIATDQFAKKAEFTNLNGHYPYGSLMEASNGRFYGYASEAGAFSNGTIFQYDTVTSTLTTALDFDSNQGGYPLYGTLCEAPNGLLYGLTSSEGVNFMGTLFEFDPVAQTATAKVDYDGSNGGYPSGSLIVGANGKLYGMTSGGGSADNGCMIEYDISLNNQSVIFEFNDAPLGSLPAGELTLASNGKFYGIAETGGAQKVGVVYEIDPATGSYSVVSTFDNTNGGYVFQYGGYSGDIISMCNASNGNLYGVSPQGGINQQGAIFEFNPTTYTLTKVADFATAITGYRPTPQLIQASDGKLYGVCMFGGATNNGTLFSFEIATGTLSNLFDFDVVTGNGPRAVLSELAPGRIFGSTLIGGVNNDGVIFVHDINQGTTTKVVDLLEADGKGSPTIMQAANGTFYYMTTSGGANSQGTICSIDTVSQSVSVLHHFDGNNSISGFTPGHLTEVNGKLYAMRAYSGDDYQGNIFEYDLATNTYSQQTDFACGTGTRPAMTTLVAINTAANSLVWPGDCNYDKVANNVDFLWMNLLYGNPGLVRSAASNNWVGQSSTAWNGAFVNTVNHKHADCNGDGIINNADTVAISLNYGQTHPLRIAPPATQAAVVDISVVALPDSTAPGFGAEFDIYIGSPGTPIDSIYGIAFSLLFDPALVNQTQTYITFTPSVLGTIGTNMQSLQKYFATSGRIDAAVCRTNHINQPNVNGAIARLHLVASSSISSINILTVTPADVTGITAGQYELTFVANSDSVVVDPAFVGLNEPEMSDVTIYPIPATSLLYISEGVATIKKVTLFDTRGLRVYEADDARPINVEDWDHGLYFVELVTEQGSTYRKVIVGR